MTLRKKERRLTIAVGLIIGVTASSFLVKHALNVKNEQAALKPGNYNSLHSAIGDVKFPPLPASVRKAIPHGTVVFFEGNRSSLLNLNQKKVDSWVIETSGSFRSERLFVLAEVEKSINQNTRFFRASEIYVGLYNNELLESFEESLDQKKFRVIGRNSSTGDHIIQVRNFSPTDLDNAALFLNSHSMVKSTRFSHWTPTR